MSYGMVVLRGHIIAPSDEVHPETGKRLYGISELKPPLTPPLFTTQSECIAYVRKLEPWDIKNRIDPYGRKRGSKMKTDMYKTKERCLSGEEVIGENAWKDT